MFNVHCSLFILVSFPSPFQPKLCAVKWDLGNIQNAKQFTLLGSDIQKMHFNFIFVKKKTLNQLYYVLFC